MNLLVGMGSDLKLRAFYQDPTSRMSGKGRRLKAMRNDE
jgi:hypothetical protein